jgi:protein SCO1/2
MTRRLAIKNIAISAMLAGAMGLFASCSQDRPAFNAIDVTGASYAKDFELADHNGKVRHLRDFAGKIVVVFFGYTQCPDVCPTAMVELAQVKKMLGKDGERLQALFVTVDPERDTAEMLKAYTENFDPSFLALIPTQVQLPQVARDFKIYYKKSAGPTATSYSMDHSAGSYIYDTQGNVRLFTRYGSGAAALSSDIALLLKESQ